MSLAKRPCKALASAMLAVAVLVAAPDASYAQDAMDATARDWERQSAEAERSQRAHTEQRQRMEQTQAHAQMPSTMYASTPDTTTPPHPFPLDVNMKRAVERSGARVSARAGVGQAHRIALFPAAARWAQSGYQGFARVISHSEQAGEVRIDAYDDAGNERGPLTLTIGAGETVHFNSTDLETGNSGKGLDGATGASEGDWRLELTSALDIDVLAYIRTEDGFLTSMHDRVPQTEAGHRVVIFNPGSNENQVSRLRLINPGEETSEVTIEGIDDDGEASGDAVELSVPAGAARTLSAKELESGGQGFTGALGTGSGKWQLVVNSEQAIEVMSLLSSPTGHLTNLSTVPGNAQSGEDGATTTYTVPLFPAASDPLGRQGFARVINHTEQPGEVRIEAFDSAGVPSDSVTLDIGANETVHFNSEDLERGNAGKGLSGGIGAGTGEWRLRLSSSLGLRVLAYIRTDDGFLTSMHDRGPETEAGHRVIMFNPGKNVNQESKLRLINPGEETAEVTIEGIDDDGESSGEVVELSLAAGAARTLSAKALEFGEGEDVSGALGTGSGKWRLVVSSDQPIEVMSLLSSPTGHLTNLSTVPGATVPSETAERVFRQHISGPIVQSKCVNCHVEGGVSGNTRLVFVRESSPEHEAHNFQTFEDFTSKVDDGADVILNKIQGVAHGGGVQVAAGTVDFMHMERFLGLLGEDVSSVTITPQTLFDTVQMAPVRKTLRRAALIFAGRTPTDEEYAAAQGGVAALRETIRGLMTGPQFHEFLIRAANDRLLTDRTAGEPIISYESDLQFVDFVNEAYRRKKAAYESGDEQAFRDWNDRVMHGARRAPLELIAHVVENDLPYTEILTADYIMANPWAATAYGASTRFDDPEDAHEFKPSRIVSYYREGDGFEHEYDPILEAARITDPGSLITDYPHAGILNTTVFLLRYPTTATNRNRARSRWTYYHFLGLDVEKSASRTTDPVALADANNPTMLNPACTVCHRVLDPVAGAFQNYGDEGMYKVNWGGVDSLDEFYKREGGLSLAIQADSWEERETLSWTVSLTAGVQTLRVLYPNHFYDESIDFGGGIYLDRLRVTDAGGGVLLSRELEDVEPPVAPWGRCGNKNYNEATGREDHLLLWGGYLECALYFEVEVPSDGRYNVEVVAWSIGQYEQYGDNGFAQLSIAVNPYQPGDTWYRDMRAPGFAGDLAPNSDNSVQWLAEKIVTDERFAEATVKFWWPAIMGSEVAEPPEDEGSADFEGLLLAANAQGAEVTRLASGLRRGFQGRAAYNLKDLLTEMVLSRWFRADAVSDAAPVRGVALRDAGARRLLTPEELARKTAALTGVQWGRRLNIHRIHPYPYRRQSNALTEEYRLLYGGIDSEGVTERARDITSVMAGVAKRHAAEVSCAVVMREFYLLPDAERRLFAGIDRYMTESGAVRSKIVELYDVLLGVQVTPHSQDVESAYRLFADVMERRRKSQDDWFNPWECEWGDDHFFFEGILDDAVVEYEGDDGWRWYGFDWDHVGDFLNSLDFSDPHGAAQTWAVVLAYLLTDYRYLYL